jgi:hypothetical protein
MLNAAMYVSLGVMHTRGNIYLNKCFAAPRVITYKRTFASVYPHMSRKVTSACKRFATVVLVASVCVRSLFLLLHFFNFFR